MQSIRLDLRFADYQTRYREWFSQLVENPDGSLNKDRVMRELADYASLIINAGRVYFEVTNGRISKLNTLWEAVVGEYEDCVTFLVDDAIDDHQCRHCGKYQK